jgi:hypothetical protein
VDGADAASWNIKYLDRVTERLERFQYFVCVSASHASIYVSDISCGIAFTVHRRRTIELCHTDDSRRVLENDPSRHNLSNDSQSFIPEPTVILFSRLLPGNADRLTGWSPANKVNWLEVPFSARFDIICVPFRVRPQFGQFPPAPFIYLHLPDYFYRLPGEHSRPLKATLETAHA